MFEADKKTKKQADNFTYVITKHSDMQNKY